MQDVKQSQMSINNERSRCCGAQWISDYDLSPFVDDAALAQSPLDREKSLNTSLPEEVLGEKGESGVSGEGVSGWASNIPVPCAGFGLGLAGLAAGGIRKYLGLYTNEANEWVHVVEAKS